MKTLRQFYHSKVELTPDPGQFTHGDENVARWSSKDLDPIPLSERTWDWYHVGGFWIAEGFSVAQMQVPSSAILLGINPGMALVACLVGNLIVLIACASSGWIGSKYGINFPVVARAAFGMWGSYLAIVIRGVICVIWYGVQGILGGTAVQCMITAIWPSFKHWHLDSLPTSAAITAPQLLSFSIFWILSLPLLYLSIRNLRWLFLVKLILMPFFWVVLFTWCLSASHGISELFAAPTKINNGSTFGFVFATTITAAISGNATFAVNMPDITRHAKNARHAAIAQVVLLPISLTLTEVLGASMALAAVSIYDEDQWNPLEVVLMFKSRVAMFFTGALFAFANIATNVTGNSVPFANDLSAMFPKQINIRRGQYVCAILAFAITPWNIEYKATRFVAFLNGYSVFLGPIAGVVICDHYIVRKKVGYNIEHLYKSHGLYSYWKGIHWRAMVALLTGMVPLFPGLSHAVNGGKMNQGILNLYTLSWLVGLVFAGFTYSILCTIFPFPLQVDDLDMGKEYINGSKVLEGSTDNSSILNQEEENSQLPEKVVSRAAEFGVDLEK